MKKIFITLAVFLTAFCVNAQDWTTVGEAGFSEDALQWGGRKSVELTVNSIDEVYVAYICDNETDKAVRVKKFNGENWVLVGNPIDFYDNNYHFNVNIETLPNDDIYVAFAAYDGTEKRQVIYKFNETIWEEIGNFKLTEGAQIDSDSFIDGDGNYCIYFYESAVGYVVKRYSGSDWETIGSTPVVPLGYHPGQVCFDIDNNGNIWMSCYGGGLGTGLGLSVYTFDGTSWTLHTGYISSGEGSATSIIIADDNTPYVAHIEYLELTPELFKYTGTEWVLEHNNGGGIGESETALAKDSYGNIFHLSEGIVGKLSVNTGSWESLTDIPATGLYAPMVGDNAGTVYVAFQDVDNSNKLTVYKHTENKTVTFNIADGLAPEITLTGYGTQTATNGSTTFENVAITSYPGIAYTVELANYETITGNIIVDNDEVIDLTLISTDIQDIQNNNINIYPNPSNGTFTITNYELQITNIEIIDITGKTIYNQQFVIRNSQFVINKAGIYFIKINTETGIYTEKLIIQ